VPCGPVGLFLYFFMLGCSRDGVFFFEFVEQKSFSAYRKKETPCPVSGLGFFFPSLTRTIQARCKPAQTWAACYCRLVRCPARRGPGWARPACGESCVAPGSRCGVRVPGLCHGRRVGCCQQTRCSGPLEAADAPRLLTSVTCVALGS